MKLKTIMESEYRGYMHLSIVIFIMCLISTIASRSNFGEMFIIYLFFVGGILLPGMALLKKFPIKGTTYLEEILFSFLIGYILSIVIYILGMTLNLNTYFSYIYLVIFAVAIIGLIKQIDVRKKFAIREKEDFTWVIAVSVIFAITFIVFSMRHVLPTYIDYNWWHNDFLHWLGNAVALKIEFPPKEFRTLADAYSYHYFGPLQLAITSLVTGLSIAEVAIVYSYIPSAVLLGLAAACLLKRVVKNNGVFLITLFLLLISTGCEKLSIVVYYWNIYMIPMSFDVAIALELVIILLMLIQFQQQEFSLTNMILLLASLLVCTGMKGPSGAVALCGIGIICIYWLLAKNYKKAFSYGVLSLVVFGTIYVLLLQSGNNAYSAGAGAVVALESGEIQISRDVLLDRIVYICKDIINYFKYIIVINPFTFLPSIIYMMYLCIKRKFECIDISLFFMIIVGTVLGYKLSYTGQSEMYFSLSVMPFAAIITGKALEGLRNSLPCINDVKLIYRRGIVLCAIISTFAIAYIGNYEGRLQLFVEQGLTTLCARENASDSDNKVMTKSEYEAYVWISQNTDIDGLFLSDRMLDSGEYCFIPGVFAERYIYRYSADELNAEQSCFSGNIANIEHYMDKGVDYIIQNKIISPEFVCPNEYGSKIYENEEVAVYQLRIL